MIRIRNSRSKSWSCAKNSCRSSVSSSPYGWPLNNYSLYKLGRAGRYYLLQTEQLGYANPSQRQQDAAQEREQESRQRLLAELLQALPSGEQQLCQFIGELQELPVGELLYTAPNHTELPVYYLHTRYGYPWIILGSTSSERAFLAEVEATEALMALQPIGLPTKIIATLLREQDAGR